MLNRRLLPFALILLLTACATPYQPDGIRGGYTDQRLDEITYLVTFRGNGYTKRERVESYLLYRCAEITVESGYDYFHIVKSDRFVSTGYTITSSSASPINKPEISATIKVFAGAKPEGLQNAYNARELMKYLGPTVQ